MIRRARFDCRSQISEGEGLTLDAQPELGLIDFDIQDPSGEPLSDCNVQLTPTDARRLATILMAMAADVEWAGR